MIVDKLQEAIAQSHVDPFPQTIISQKPHNIETKSHDEGCIGSAPSLKQAKGKHPCFDVIYLFFKEQSVRHQK